MPNIRLFFAGLFGLTAVAFGAFGAHALKLSERWSDIYSTASHYHLAHAIVLLCLALCFEVDLHARRKKWLGIAFILMFLGTIIFSGSLYILAVTEITKLGMITPIGGGLLMMAWLCLAIVGVLKKK